MSRRVLLKGGQVVTMNPNRDVLVADVCIQDDRLISIDADIEESSDDDIVDCTGRIVIPGLIQPHVHLCQTLFRGYADDLELLPWLKTRIWPFEAAHTHDSLFISAMLGGAELLRSGTTSILDMGTVHHTDAVFEAVSRLGLRATVGKAMMDAGEDVPEGLKETAESSLAESLALIKRWHGKEQGRLRYAFAPRFVLSCTEELMTQTVQEARARGLILHTHASENQSEVDAVRARFGQDNIMVLHQMGLCGPDTVLAHGIWLTTEEERLLADTQTNIVHCPSANLKLGSGFAKVPHLLERGINVALAADGAPCNNNLDGFTEMRLAGLIHKPTFGPTAMPAQQVVEMATIRGARALGLQDEVGTLEVGKKADITVVNPDQLHAVPTVDPYSMIVYALGRADVEHVFVDGILRVKEGQLLGVDTPSILSSARQQAQRIVPSIVG